MEEIQHKTIIVNLDKCNKCWIYTLKKEYASVDGKIVLEVEAKKFPDKKSWIESAFSKQSGDIFEEGESKLTVREGLLRKLSKDLGNVNLYIILPSTASELKNPENTTFLIPSVEKLDVEQSIIGAERRASKAKTNHMIENADYYKILEQQQLLAKLLINTNKEEKQNGTTTQK